MKSDLFKKAILHAVLIIAVIICLGPLIIMLLNSFKTGSELASNSWGFPKQFVLNNYGKLLSFNAGIIVKTYLNGIFISVSYTFLTIIVSAMAAYAFSKYKFKGNLLIFILLIATMMIPAEITIPPLYIFFSKIKWLNTYWVQIIPGIANVFCMFMLKQYMDSLPNSLIEAARIDGAGHFHIFYRVMMPLATPAIGALTILTFLGKWNDYLWPKIMLTKTNVMPIMVVLPTLNDKDSIWSIPWEIIMAGCTVVTMPIIILFFIFQDRFMSSVTIGAVKE